MNEIQPLIALLFAQKWLAFCGALVHLATRLVKSDTKFPVNIAPRYRPLVPLGLSALAAGLDMAIAGAPLVEAAKAGATILAFAIFLHVFGIQVARGGKEVIVPGLMIPGAAPGPGKAPSIPPSPWIPVELDEEPAPASPLPVIEMGDRGTPTEPSKPFVPDPPSTKPEI